MSLQVPSFTDQYHATPLVNAYAWITLLAFDYFTGNGRIEVSVHPDAASAAALKTPIARVSVQPGQVLVKATENTPAVTFPTLVELFTAAAAAQRANPALDPEGAIREALYQALLGHPLFAGSTEVP